ncbi:MAG: histidine kinase, partial [Ornithinimicrobium sp.]
MPARVLGEHSMGLGEAVVGVAMLRERAVSTAAPPWARASAWWLSLAGWSAGLTVTVLILATPIFAFGVRSPSLHLVLDSVDASVALLVAYLVHGSFVRRSRWQDLLISQGLVLLAVAGLGLSALADLFDGFAPGTLDVWWPLTVRVLGAVLIVAGAFAGTRTTSAHVLQRWPVVPAAVVVAAVLGLLLALGSRLPVALDLSVLPASAQHPLLTGHVLLLLAQALGAVCFLVASVAYTAQAARYQDELLRWLGPACALAGFARLNYLLFPSLYTDWLYTGDLLRTGCYLLLLVGATREIRRFWTTQAEVAVLADRHRLARELHDGVIQELSYIRSESHDLPAAAEVQSGHIIGACDRALDEARSAVQALSHTGGDPLGLTLHRAAQQVADRYGVSLEVELDDAVATGFEQRHALVRITREAVSNAARHGGAQHLTLRLAEQDGRRQLSIGDDGAGFD